MRTLDVLHYVLLCYIAWCEDICYTFVTIWHGSECGIIFLLLILTLNSIKRELVLYFFTLCKDEFIGDQLYICFVHGISQGNQLGS